MGKTAYQTHCMHCIQFFKKTITFLNHEFHESNECILVTNEWLHDAAIKTIEIC